MFLTSLRLAAAAIVSFVSLPPEAPQQPQPPESHLVLVVEGDVTALRVTRAVRKPAPCAADPKGLQSEFRVVVLDAEGNALGSRLLDLSAFDTDPKHIGRPVRVDGCIVRDWRIGLLVNVPDFPQAASLVIWRGKQRLGGLGQADLLRLLGGGR